MQMILPDDFLDQFRAAYPKRQGDQGWVKVRKLIPRRVEEGHDWATILKGAENYRIHCTRQQMIGTVYVKQACTFVGPDCWFDEWATIDMRTPAEIALERDWADLEARAIALGFREVDRSKGLSVVRYAIEQRERLRVVK